MTTLKRIDLSDISGTNMYCSEEAKEEIRKRLRPYGPCGIHFLDNGNYHYMTKFFVEKICEPYALVLFDHHSDMHQTVIGVNICGECSLQEPLQKLLEDDRVNQATNRILYHFLSDSYSR